jgi:hypothetical protein
LSRKARNDFINNSITDIEAFIKAILEMRKNQGQKFQFKGKNPFAWKLKKVKN